MTSPGRYTDLAETAGYVTVTGFMAAADFRQGDLIANRYRIERLLGMGGMGVVYLARDIELDIDIALKLLRPELASRPEAFERFRQELLLARQVSSPHVVRIHDLVKHGNTWLISMDYVPGQSLEHRLAKEGPLPPEQAIELTRQLALGLSAAHLRGVVHRDLKPANVLLDANGAASITDFGVARSAGSTGITGSGIVIGTPEYLSPEQARAEPIDGRSDLYALGLILYEMLTGTLPFRGGTPAEMLVQRIMRPPPPVDSVKQGLPVFAVQLCSHLLALKPAQRFQSASEVVQAIDARHLPKQRQARRKALFFSGVLTLAMLAASLVWMQLRPPADPGEPAVRNVIPARVDVVPLPLSTTLTDEDSLNLASGIGYWIADSLTRVTGIHSADPSQVSRALNELRYDANAASRHTDRVLEVMNAHAILEGELVREDNGWTIGLALVEAGSTQPRWRSERKVANDISIPAALQNLLGEAFDALGIRRPPPESPDAEIFRLIGGHLRDDTTIDNVDTSARNAQQHNDPTLWWLLQRALDRTGRTAEAASVARQAKDALADDRSFAGRRAYAYALVLLGDHPSATALLEELEYIAPNDRRTQVLRARALGESGSYDDARRVLDAVAAQDPRNFEAWYLLGKYSIQAGDAKRAIDDYLVRAQILANRLDDTRRQADVNNALGIAYRRLGQMEPAAERLEVAIRLRKNLGDARAQAASLRNLATVRSIQGRFEEAETALSEARTIIEPLGDAIALADLANDSGVLEEERGDHQAALAHYRDALTLRQAHGDPRLIGESQINVGFAYYAIGEFDNAQTYWQQAADTYAEIDDRVGLVHATQSLGLTEIARGDWVKARQSFQTSLDDAEEMQMAEERTISMAGLAELDRLEGHVSDALRRSDIALAQFTQRDDLRGIVEMKLLRSQIFSDIGSWEDAHAALDELEPPQIGNGEQAGILIIRQGTIALGQGNAEAALALADDAVALAQQSNSRGTELSARLLRVRSLDALGRDAEASAEIAHVREGFKRYASVPLRLMLAETELMTVPSEQAAKAAYHESQALIARLPAYGRLFLIHLAAARLGLTDDAPDKAQLSYSKLVETMPPELLEPLERLAAESGMAEDPSQ